MKKSLILLSLLLVLSLTLVTAAPECSDGSEPDSSLRGLDVGERRSINGVGIGLIDSDEIYVLRRFTAEIILEAKKISLSNETPEIEIELDSEDITIRLLGVTSDLVEVEVDDSSRKIEEGEVDSVGGFDVMVLSFSGNNASDMEATLLVGIEQISFSNDENPSVIEKIDGENYLIELFSASETQATFRVSTCETGEVRLKAEPEPDPIPEPEVNDTIPEVNETIPTPEAECLTGQRQSEQYCDDSKTFVSQKEPNTACENDYECTLNECKSSECKDLGFFGRFLRFLSNLFS